MCPVDNRTFLLPILSVLLLIGFGSNYPRLAIGFDYSYYSLLSVGWQPAALVQPFQDYDIFRHLNPALRPGLIKV